MEKHTSHYSLEDIKQAFAETDSLRMSVTALRDAISLGLTRDDIVAVIQMLTVKQLHKSMTSERDHRVWQDVYYASYQELSLYVKFTVDDEGYFLISFKEK
jgi:motility quorum-sensing regulator/GCU-specific mRNA interferase toxin